LPSSTPVAQEIHNGHCRQCPRRVAQGRPRLPRGGPRRPARRTGATRLDPIPDRRRRLGTGYAQILNLAATPDLSAASYRVGTEGPTLKLDVLRLPYQAKWIELSADTDLYWKLSGGYLQMKQDLPLSASAPKLGSIASKWSAYSVGGGLLARMRLGNGFTLEPALDVGVALLDNGRATTEPLGAAAAARRLLFNWQANAWLTTPSLALAWSGGDAEGKATVRGHVARS